MAIKILFLLSQIILKLTKSNNKKNHPQVAIGLLLYNYSYRRATYLPMMEHWKTKSLALSVCSQISLKSERVNGWNECFNSVQWRTRYWGVLSNMASKKKRKFLAIMFLQNTLNELNTCTVHSSGGSRLGQGGGGRPPVFPGFSNVNYIRSL